MPAIAPFIKAARWAAAGQLGDRLREHLRMQQRARRIAASPLFDAAWYRSQYPDIGDANPALHYLVRGAAEGRSPGPRFAGEWYLQRYRDVLNAGENPLWHYIEHGLKEGREIAPVSAIPLPRLPLDNANYRRWVQAYDVLDEARREAVRRRVRALKGRVRFSVVLLEAEGDCDWPTLEAQLYPDWEVLTPDSNAAATGEYAVFLPLGVALAETALARMALAIDAEPDADMVYADEDRIGPDGQRCEPDFKPDWDPDLALERDLIGPTGAYRRTLIGAIGAPRSASELPAFARRFAARARRIVHVPAILFHRRAAAPNVAPMHVRLAEPAPAVTIIIPTRDRARLLARCVDGLLQRTDYARLNILIVNNDSKGWRTKRLLRRLSTDPRVAVLPFPGAFNWSAMNNAAVQHTRSEIVVLLNNDIDVIGPLWLQEMVAHAIRPDVGLVGAKLFYPNGTIQHGGIVLGPAGAASHLMRHAARDDPGYQGQLVLTRTVSAVTG
ncbi:MAG: glycosyltransferase, partial [Acetobacteraceae bacterium]|nr:glycosyltransferase [Acetobacteraceae bacterium]